MIDAKTAPIDCTVVDLSAGGACLEFPRPPQVPDTVEFLHGGVKKIATVAWRRGYRIGISFSASNERSISSSGLARPSPLRR